MFKKPIIALPVILALMLNGLAFATPQPQVAQADTAATVIYNLYATDTFVLLADGTRVYNYGFVGGRQGVSLRIQKAAPPQPEPPAPPVPPEYFDLPGGAPAPTGGHLTDFESTNLAGNAQFPAPLIYAATGDVVEIRMKNLGTTNPGSPNDPHSIHLHGLDVNAANDGVPETSVGAVPANSDDPGAGNVVVYMFSPKNPGTYMYHCHQEADIHVQMGMYGALIVYNKGDVGAKKGPGSGPGNLWGWKYDRDVVLLLSEIDTGQHVSEQTNGDFNPVNYQPQYWMINGLSFPNTIHADGGSAFDWGNWNRAHPGYDPFIVGHVNGRSAAGTTGDKVLLRMINMGFETQPMHMHGFHGKILGSDQRSWLWAQPLQPIGGAGKPGIGLEKNTLTIGSGETYEWLLDFGVWKNQSTSTYAAGVQTRYFDPDNAACVAQVGGLTPPPVAGQPVSNTFDKCPTIDGYTGGPPVVGAAGGVLWPEGQLFPFHNHDDYKATNNGQYPGGMFTMIQTVP